MFSYVNYPRVAHKILTFSFFFFFFFFSCRSHDVATRTPDLDGNTHSETARVLEIEWAVKNGKEFVPSPRKPRKPRGKKRKVAAINLNRGRGEGSFSSMDLSGQRSMGLASLDEGEGDETVDGCEDMTEVSLLGKIKEEEYEGNGVTLEMPAKRVRSDVE